ncbi:MAG: tRNA (adenosine(37)-N6)-threonylcarbamoyltransferase complex ATPase subunit type 1 TsaE, partial [Planctomycetota bacterium]
TGSLLKAGNVIALMGQLGAGKTCLVKGIAEGQGVKDRKVVTSPSFVLVKQYTGRIPIYHFDAYRMKSPDEMYDIDCVEFFWGNGISIVEWADKVMECLPDEFIKIAIKSINQTSREIRVSYKGEKYENFMKEIKEKIRCLK